MTEFDEAKFLDWLEEQNGYHVSASLVEEEWPEFNERYQMNGITILLKDGESLVPKRDYRDTVIHGHPRD